MNVEGSADSPPWTRIVQMAGVDVSVTRLRSRAEQFRCDPHGALVTATLKAGGWTRAHRAQPCTCTDEELQPILDAIAAAQSNGHGTEEEPRLEEAKPDQKQYSSSGDGHRTSSSTGKANQMACTPGSRLRSKPTPSAPTTGFWKRSLSPKQDRGNRSRRALSMMMAVQASA